MKTTRTVVWALAMVVASGCGESKKAAPSGDDESDTASPTKQKHGSSSGVAASASATAPKSSGSAQAAASASSAPDAIPLGPGRTPVPTVAEWDAEKREVTVKGSSSLGCETKMVREYLRVSCRGKNDSGGTPEGVVPSKGVRESYQLVGAGVVSIVVPYLEGIDATFLFGWSDKAHSLVLKWPRGAPKPPILGVFEGASSPLDHTGGNPALCKRCEKELGTQYGEGVCGWLFANPLCVKTFPNDCDMLRQCAFGEPSAQVTCPAGQEHISGHQCASHCGAGKSCPSGFSCSDAVTGEFLCIED